MGQVMQFEDLSGIIKARSNRSTLAGSTGNAPVESVFEIALRSIEAIDRNQREELLKLLAAWMLQERFGLHGPTVFEKLQAESIANCIFANLILAETMP
jgi:hypothetical protein